MTTNITVIGTRGIPDVLGGVETHCQNLYPEIKTQFDTEICVIARSPYVDYKKSTYRGVNTKAIWAPKKKSLEAIVHSTLSSFSTLFDRSNIVHVHAIGPGLVVPLLRVLGKKVVFTHHGPDYDRQKWGEFAKRMLQLGERLAVTYATEVIVISEVINDIIKSKYNRHDAHLVYNGVNLPTPLPQEKIDAVLTQFTLTENNYLVAVGRLVEEKGFHDLISAYEKANIDIPLVIMGDTDHPTPYSEQLKAQAKHVDGVIMTGFLKGEQLQSIFSKAKAFVMPSYHEGLPIALLEAMSYSLPAIVSNIPANLEVKLSPESYFPVGDIDSLTTALINHSIGSESNVNYSQYLAHYDWHKIAGKTMAIYDTIEKKRTQHDG
ncbi:glycosyltransferase family 4 protein [Aliivibrio salmonicida]|uniref:glycosyltransferase family 4 protein n=1 Tax=Aliivibrio salmonicida TaxID=40269 RepID=UPI003D14A217